MDRKLPVNVRSGNLIPKYVLRYHQNLMIKCVCDIVQHVQNVQRFGTIIRKSNN